LNIAHNEAICKATSRWYRALVDSRRTVHRVGSLLPPNRQFRDRTDQVFSPLSMKMDSCCLISKQVHDVNDNGVAEISHNRWQRELTIYSWKALARRQKHREVAMIMAYQ
jgi:hypothetical protein